MIGALAVAGLTALGAARARPADSSSYDVRLIPAADTVFVFLGQRPPLGGGFVVYRGRVGAPLVKVTAQPIRGARTPVEAAGMMGADLGQVERSLEQPDLLGSWRRLQAESFASGVLSGYYRGVARALGRIYADTGAVRGETYAYRVVITDAAGKATGHVFTGRVHVADVLPVAPTRLSAAVGDHVASLEWTYPKYRPGGSDNAIGFHVYRAEGTDTTFHRLTTAPILRNESAPLTYTDRTVENGVQYRYRVAAVDVIQREGPASEPLPVVPADKTPPAAPVGVDATHIPGAVQVVWRLSPEPDAAGYYVRRSDEIRGSYSRITPKLVPVTTPSFADSSAEGGRVYYYEIVAVDRSGNASAPSNAAMALVHDTIAPPVPQGLTARPVSHRLAIAWHPSRAPDLRGYWVYRLEHDGATLRLGSDPISDTTVVDSGYGGAGLHAGERYVIAVSAVDSTGNESARDSVVVRIPDDVAPPRPTGFVAHGVEGRYVELSWSQVPAADLASFVLRRAHGDSSAVLVGRYPGEALLARDTTARHGAEYAYTLEAVDSAGNVSPAAVDTVRFRRTSPPPAPRHIAVTAGPNGAVVRWERVADPELAGYRVYHAAIPTGVYRLVGSTPAHVTTLTDAKSARGGFYEVRAVDSSGNESAASPAAGGARP